jgi:hypothetical protein
MSDSDPTRELLDPAPVSIESIADCSLILSRRPRRRLWFGLSTLALWGPGLVVMLADTDAGSLITASQSGAQWGYRMVLPQVLLIPILYVVQEMTVRLGIITGQGHGSLIRTQFGKRWAILSAGTLILSAIGAPVTEFAGIAGVGTFRMDSPNTTSCWSTTAPNDTAPNYVPAMQIIGSSIKDDGKSDNKNEDKNQPSHGGDANQAGPDHGVKQD